MSELFEPSGLGATIFQERYAHTGESYEDSCWRVADAISKAENNGKQDKFKERFYWQLRSGKFMPGGRIMSGSGRKTPNLLNCYGLGVSDSIEGWKDAVGDTMIISSKGGGVGINYTPIRPRGYPISGMGGTATGAVSLMQAVDRVGDIIKDGAGRRTALMMCLDINHPDIEEFLNAKLDLGQLRNANISVGIPANMSIEDFQKCVREDLDIPLVFNGRPDMFERVVKGRWLWDSLVKNAWESGEPGVLNFWLANRMNNIAYIRPVITCNPCLSYNSRLLTKEFGLAKIGDLVDKEFSIYNADGEWAKSSAWLTGEKQTYLITLENGLQVETTGDHVFEAIDANSKELVEVMAKDLPGCEIFPMIAQCSWDGVETIDERTSTLFGFIFGNGYYDHGGVGFKNSEVEVIATIRAYCVDRGWEIFTHANGALIRSPELMDELDNFGLELVPLPKRTVPEALFSQSPAIVKAFLRGLYSANGTAQPKRNRISLKGTSVSAIRDIQRLLMALGHNAYITTNKLSRIKWPNGTYVCRESHDLNIGSAHGYVRFQSDIGFLNEHKMRAGVVTSSKPRGLRPTKVKSVEKIGFQPVYDFREPITHWGWVNGMKVHNCSEQYLTDGGNCCLGALVLPRFIDSGGVDWDSLDESIRLGVRFLDNVIDINVYPIQKTEKTAKEERRIGLGVMGLHSALLDLGMKYDSEEAFEFVDKLFSFIKNTAYDASITLAAEKGSFPLYRPEFVSGGFVKTLKRGIRNKIKEHGIRNCALLTCAPTGCQVGDTAIITNQGIVQLTDIGDPNGVAWQVMHDLEVEQPRMLTSERLPDVKTREQVSRFFVNGYAETKKLVLSSGTVLEATYNHQYKILRNGEYRWIRSDEMVEGDLMVIPLGTYTKSAEPELTDVRPYHFDEKDMLLPLRMNPKLAYFLGVFFGDGSMHTEGIRIACNAKHSDWQKVASIGEELFGIKPTLHNDDHDCLSVAFNSSRLLRWLYVNGLDKQLSNHIEIPYLIRTASRKSLSAFMDGFFFIDGWTNRAGERFFDTSSLQTARLFVTIIRALGKDSYISLQQSGLDRIAYRVCEIKTFRSTTTRAIREQLKENGLKNCVVDPVVSIESSTAMTYDIEVPENQTYIANGVISHNTTSMVHGVTGGIEPVFSPVYIRRRRVVDKRQKENIAETLVVSEEYLDHADIVQGAYDIHPQNHLKMQVIVQKHIDSAVSKTVNIPKDFPVEDLSDIWLDALPGMKGSTFYREGSRETEDSFEPMRHVPVDKMQETVDSWAGELEYEISKGMDCASGACDLPAFPANDKVDAK